MCVCENIKDKIRVLIKMFFLNRIYANPYSHYIANVQMYTVINIDFNGIFPRTKKTSESCRLCTVLSDCASAAPLCFYKLRRGKVQFHRVNFGRILTSGKLRKIFLSHGKKLCLVQ